MTDVKDILKGWEKEGVGFCTPLATARSSGVSLVRAPRRRRPNGPNWPAGHGR